MTQTKDKDSLKVHFPVKLKADKKLLLDMDPGNPPISIYTTDRTEEG